MTTILAEAHEMTWRGEGAPTLVIKALRPFFTPEDVHVLAQGADLRFACTLDGAGRVVTPQISLRPTEGSLDHPTAQYLAHLEGEFNGGAVSVPFGVFGEGFAVPDTNIPQTWADIRVFMRNTQPGQVLHPVNISGLLTAALLHVLGSARIDGALTAPEVAGNMDVAGAVTALNHIGSGAGLHSLPSGVVTPNSLSSTGSVSLNADTDGNGDGEAALAVGGITRLRARAGDGVVEMPYGGIILDKGGQVYNAALWGASTGSTANQGAIQDAIDEAFAAGGGVVLLTNLYMVTGQINLKSNVTLRAVPGRGGLLANGNFKVVNVASSVNVILDEVTIDGQVALAAGGNDLVYVSDSSHVRVQGCNLLNGRGNAVSFVRTSDARATGNYVKNPAFNGIMFFESQDGAATGNFIEDAGLVAQNFDNGKGIGIQTYLEHAAGNERIVVADNIIKNCYQIGIEAWSPDEARRSKWLTITGNIVERLNPVASEFGVSVNRAQFVSVMGNTVRGTIYGYEIAAGKNVTITGNSADSLTGIGIAVSQGGERFVIANNTIYNPADHGIQILGGAGAAYKDFVISGNEIYGAGNRGIFLNEMGVDAAFTITGNKIRGCQKSAIYLYRTDGGAITGNHIAGNNLSEALGESPLYLNTDGIASVFKIAHVGNYGDPDSYLPTPLLLGGYLEILNAADGMIQQSPDGTRYRLTVANGGTSVWTPV